MDWILSNVAVGSWRDANDEDILEREDIKAILNVRADEERLDIKEANKREEQYCQYRGFAYCFLPVPDYTPAEDEQLISGVAFIEKQLTQVRKY